MLCFVISAMKVKLALPLEGKQTIVQYNQFINVLEYLLAERNTSLLIGDA